MNLPPPPPPVNAPPGWYPTTPGMQGYWDGVRWTGDVAPLVSMAPSADDSGLPLLAHLLGLFTSFVGPLVLYLVKKDESAAVAHHARESLNFQISLIVYYICSVFLMLLLVGFLTLVATFVISIVFPIMGAVAANRGEQYRYPLSIRFVS